MPKMSALKSAVKTGKSKPVARNIFLSLGSNIEPEKNIPACLKILKENFKIVKISSCYETAPVGPAGDKKFWNLAVAIHTSLAPGRLNQKLRQIEKKLKRKRNSKDKFAPRTIDLDLLPQQGYQEQGFIIIPLAEIAPREKDPETGKTFEKLGKVFKSGHSIRKIRTK